MKNATEKLGKALMDFLDSGGRVENIPILREKFLIKLIVNQKFKVIVYVLIGWITIHNWIGVRFDTDNCNIQLPHYTSTIFRPPIDCGFCEEVDNFDIRKNLAPDEFDRVYAHTGRPVKVSDGAVNWTAVELFDYWYFKSFYEEYEQENDQFNCQFFPYKSGFKQIYDAFRMAESRVNQRDNEEPWYFGWSNCNAEIAREFRKHYSKPYFLSEISENNEIDWIFIGVPGMGAHLHIDNVRLPSWQAQLKGSKKWEISPPPECYFKCKSFEVIVNPGEIIVLDTNKWFHKTNVVPGAVSVTIGAEYD